MRNVTQFPHRFIACCVLLASIASAGGEGRSKNNQLVESKSPQPIQSQNIPDEYIRRLINWRRAYINQWAEAARILHDDLTPGIAGSADADVGRAFAKGAFADVADLISPKQVQGIAAGVVNGISAAEEEADRASKARDWQSFSAWLNDYRRVLGNHLTKSEADVRNELETKYPPTDNIKRKELLDALSQMDTWRIPRIEAIEVKLFELWMKAQWDANPFKRGYIKTTWEVVRRAPHHLVKQCLRSEIAAGVFTEGAEKRVDRFIIEKDITTMMRLWAYKRVCFSIHEIQEVAFEICAWVNPDNSILSIDSDYQTDTIDEERFRTLFIENMKNGRIDNPIWWFSACKDR